MPASAVSARAFSESARAASVSALLLAAVTAARSRSSSFATSGAASYDRPESRRILTMVMSVSSSVFVTASAASRLSRALPARPRFTTARWLYRMFRWTASYRSPSGETPGVSSNSSS
ncbi:hypothetical protein G6F23_014802 [Rhizopus arrhizus]|nr:hypothetical protein G6F23_014802 [Rhizopus arrhizus]